MTHFSAQAPVGLYPQGSLSPADSLSRKLEAVIERKSFTCNL